MVRVLVGALLLMFLLMHAVPGNPWSNYASSQPALSGLGMDRVTQSALERQFGLDLPLWRQFIRYVVGDVDATGQWQCGAVCGHLGQNDIWKMDRV